MSDEKVRLRVFCNKCGGGWATDLRGGHESEDGVACNYLGLMMIPDLLAAEITRLRERCEALEKAVTQTRRNLKDPKAFPYMSKAFRDSADRVIKRIIMRTRSLDADAFAKGPTIVDPENTTEHMADPAFARR